MDGSPPGLPGGGMTGVEPVSGVGARISGSIPGGGHSTPSDLASLSPSGSLACPVVVLPRGTTVLAGGTAAPTDSVFALEANVGSETYGILSNLYLAQRARTTKYTCKVVAAAGATTDYEGGVATARKLGQLGLPDLSQTPQILIEFVESDREPGGLGEIGVPVVAPAIANAMFAATGRRIRRIPLSAQPL